MKSLKTSLARLWKTDKVVQIVPPNLAPEEKKSISLPPSTSTVQTSLKWKNTPAPPVIALGIVGFHHAKGPIVETVFPPELSEISQTFHCDGEIDNSTDTSPSGTESGKSHLDVKESGVGFFHLDCGVDLSIRSEHQKSGGAEEDLWNDLTAFLAALHQIPFLALPDGAHRSSSDSNIFLINRRGASPLFGLSYVKSIETDQLEYVAQEVTRSVVQKSVFLISRVPLWFRFLQALETASADMFVHKDGHDLKILEQLWKDLNGNINEIDFPGVPPNPPPADVDEKIWRWINQMTTHVSPLPADEAADINHILLHKGNNPLIHLRPKHILVLLKAILLEKRIIIYSTNAAQASALVVFLVSLLPGARHLGRPWRQTDLPGLKRMTSMGCPLNVFSPRHTVLPYVTLQMLDDLNGLDGFLIGVTNNLCLTQSVLPCDVQLSIASDPTETTTLTIRDRGLRQLLSLTEYERKFIRAIHAAPSAEESGPDDSPTLSDQPGQESAEEDVANSERETTQPSSLTMPPLESPFEQDKRSSSVLSSRRTIEREIKNAISRLVSKTGEEFGITQGRPESKVSPLVHHLKLPKGFNRDNLPLDRINAEQPLSGLEAFQRDLQTYVELFLRVCAFCGGPQKTRSELERSCHARVHGISNFNAHFVKAWSRTNNCHQWLSSHQLPQMARYSEPPKSGWAVYTYLNDDVFRGQFLRSLRHGEGTYAAVSGLSYTGWWSGDKRHGYGILRHPASGFTYSGMWKEDVKEGHGVLTSSRDKYVGAFSANDFHGEGVYDDVWGNHYEGAFSNGLFHGFGQLDKATGETYKGHWVAGKFGGSGVRRLADSTEFSGSFVDGLAEGLGTVTHPDTSSFVGQWKQGNRHGAGKFKCQRVVKSCCDEESPMKKELTIRLAGHWQEDSPDFSSSWSLCIGDGLEFVGGLSRVEEHLVLDGWGIARLPGYGHLEGLWEAGVQHQEGLWTQSDQQSGGWLHCLGEGNFIITNHAWEEGLSVSQVPVSKYFFSSKD